MTYARFLCTVALLLILPGLARAMTLDTLEQQLSSQGNVSGTFDQQRYLADLDTAIKGHGRYAFEQGERVRWHLLAPVDQDLVLDRQGIEQGGEMFRDDPAGVARLILQVLQGDLNALRSRFEIDITGSPGDWQAHLTPRSDTLRRYLDHLDLSGDRHMRHVRMAMHNGDRLDITLHPNGATPQ
ncbi:LolA family protein [Kushneria phosphatilytica]|uniref:Outer membrane lipoprotein carrier protein LolA n=1 Tax=Kushneria phosphatilytica TaxID=657387 RepID=A0A1S1NUZ9_9GAMM|nr:outer membrane lipoprotein carrier protein LolA [Kushneria phosphatilytica]OHV10550.1 hypothetical protein BH688_09150 [Kushneria phosphatilytica]QEL11878.1 outer membrane lipoprotein carrier protein LolA [Kushneria phosphatilytica]